jgi:hypothetical protein
MKAVVLRDQARLAAQEVGENRKGECLEVLLHRGTAA